MYVKSVVGTLDDRLGTARGIRKALDKAFPDNWSFMIGEVALYCFVLLLATGTYLTFFFSASGREVTYQGSYAPLHGTRMTEAYRSTVDLSLDVRAGLLIRQMHHWAALLFLAAIILHLCRIFFTAAFRKPRELNWIIGVSLFVLALANGFTGYSLPDDLLSATGLRIAYFHRHLRPAGRALRGHVVLRGADGGPRGHRPPVHHPRPVHPGADRRPAGGAPGHPVAPEAHPVPRSGTRGAQRGGLPAVAHLCRAVGLAAVHRVGDGRRPRRVGQINPIWLYGPSSAGAVSTQAQPDWYLGWTEGALRMMPAIRFHVFGFRFPEVFIPGVVLPGITFVALYAWPFIERRFTGDRGEHHLLDRPRDRPWRTGLGATVLAFYVVLFIAGGEDIWASQLGVSVVPVRTAFRIAIFVIPPLVGLFTAKVCRDLLAAVPRSEAFEHG